MKKLFFLLLFPICLQAQYLGTSSSIIYIANGNQTVTLTLTNNTTGVRVLTVKSSSTIYNSGSNMFPNGVTVWNIPLNSGDYIIAYADSANTVSYQLTANGASVAQEAVSDTSLASIISLAQSAEGVSLTQLSNAQVRALLAVLLYKAGGVNVTNLTVKKLSSWASQ